MKLKKTAAAILAAILLSGVCLAGGDTPPYDEADAVETAAAVPEIAAPSAILMEKSTGTVLFEKNADEKREPASVTKVMTLLLIAEAVEAGKITLDDTVTVSAYAASMGGSQIFLSEGETMSVRDMLKAIVVSSANDAAVAMAEYISGTEEAFVAAMNEKARALGMKNTVFMNSTGLLEQPEHLTTARDIALMSRELICHDMIKEYTTIWTDTVRDGSFGLSNTNKLIRFYSGATGLKTGYTSKAGYCLSATAEREGAEYIAVVLGCATSDDRFESAKALLSYAFSNYTLLAVRPEEALPPVRVILGEKEYLQPVLSGESSLLTEREKASGVTREVELPREVPAPVKEGQELGSLILRLEGRELIRAPITAAEASPKLSRGAVFGRIAAAVFLGKSF